MAAPSAAPSGNYGDAPAEMVPYNQSQAPERRFFQAPLEFRGPGRDAPDPVVPAINIGLLAPLHGTDRDADGQNVKRGVELAFAEANAAGGVKGVPFALLAYNDDQKWGASSNTLVRMAYMDKDWVVIGSLDSNSTHIALRATLKAEIPLVNVGANDPTIGEHAMPWLVRLTPDDRQTGYRLAGELFEHRKLQTVAVVRSGDRYGRFGVIQFRNVARRLSRPLPLEILFAPGTTDFTTQLDRLATTKADGVAIWGSAADAGRLVKQMRDRGITAQIALADRALSPAFLDAAGPAAEGAVVTSALNPDSTAPAWVAFRGRFQAKYGEPPDALATYGYVAGQAVVDAVRGVGLNRARLRDALVGPRTFPAVPGTIRLDMNSNNITPPFLARVKGGRFVFE